MEKSKKIKKRTIILAAVGALLGALGIFLLVWYFGASYPAYYALATEQFSIPGLTNISPQGLCTLPENEQGYDFAMSGYMTDKTASRIYLIDADTDTSKYVTVTQNGKQNTSHFGGVACTPNYLLVTSGKSVLRLSLADALAAENGSALTVYDKFSVDIQCSFVSYYDGTVFVGEFYRAGNYETAKEHHISVTGGTNYAFIYAFHADETAAGGIAETVPYAVLSVRELVQGVAVYEGGITLSCSYGLADSVLYTYLNPLGTQTEKTAKVGEADVPLYVLDDGTLQSQLVAPCMSEEICVKGDRLYVLYESLCDKYRLFTRTRIDKVHALPLVGLKGVQS